MGQIAQNNWSKCSRLSPWTMPRYFRRKQRESRWPVKDPSVIDLLLVEESVEWKTVEITPNDIESSEQINVIHRLESAATSGDERAFSAALKDVEWGNRPVGDFVKIIRLAFKSGTIQAAYIIATEGLKFHPHDSVLQRYATTLAPPERLSPRKVAPDMSRKANREWLKNHAGEYLGKWVALRNGELVAVAESLDGLVKQVGNTTGLLLTPGY